MLCGGEFNSNICLLQFRTDLLGNSMAAIKKNLYVCESVSLYLRMSVSLYVCTHVCLYVCMYLCLFCHSLASNVTPPTY